MTIASGSIRAGRSHVEIGADTSPLGKGLKLASAKLQAWGRSVSSLGRRLALPAGAALTSLLAAGKSYASMGDTIAKAAKRAGIGATEFSRLAYAAERADVPVNNLSVALFNMQRKIATGELQKEFAAMGRSLEGIEKLGADQQFLMIADAIASIEGEAAKAAVAQSAFGRSARSVLTMFRGSLRKDVERADLVGATWSPAEAARAETVSDRFADIRYSLARTLGEIGNALMNIMVDNADRLLAVLQRVRDFLVEHRDLIGKVTIALGGLLVAGLALTAIGGVFSALSAGLQVLTAAASLLTNVWVLGFAGVAAGVAYLISLVIDLDGVLNSAFKALLSGDIALAWDIVANAAKLAFERMKNNAIDFFLSIKNKLVAWIASAIQQFSYLPERAAAAVYSYFDEGAWSRDVEARYAEAKKALEEQQKLDAAAGADRTYEQTLQKQLDELMAKAKKEDEDKEEGAPAPAAPPTPTWQPRFDALKANAGGAAAAAIMGTFSARAAQNMAQMRDQPVVNAIEKSNDLLKDILNELEAEEGGVFE